MKRLALLLLLAACGKEPPKPPVRVEPPETALTAVETYWSIFDGFFDEKNAELLGGAVTKEEIAAAVKTRRVMILRFAKALAGLKVEEVEALLGGAPVKVKPSGDAWVDAFFRALGGDAEPGGLGGPGDARTLLAFVGKSMLFTLFELESLPAYAAADRYDVLSEAAGRPVARHDAVFFARAGLRFISDGAFCRALLGSEPKIESQGGAMATYAAVRHREYPEASKLVEEAARVAPGSEEAEGILSKANAILGLAPSAPECLAAAKAIRTLDPQRLGESHAVELAYAGFYRCNEAMRAAVGEKPEAKFKDAMREAEAWLATAKPSEKFESRVQPLIDAKKIDEAVGVCREALDIKPGDADALIMLRRATRR